MEENCDLLGSTTMFNCDLPGDIVVEILLRLPTKSLLRFRCVSKPWCSLIKNPTFVKKHLNRSTLISDGTFLLINRRHKLLPKNIIYMIDHNTLRVRTNIHIPFPINTTDCLRVIGSANGLLCVSFSHFGAVIVLWNPATRELRGIPRSPIPRPPRKYPFSVHLGFGFQGANEYKLIRIIYYRGSHDFPSQVEVYTLSTDSWREINNVPQFVIVERTSTSPVLMDGVLYWTAIGIGEPYSGDIIISFDIGKEVFGKIILPMYEGVGGREGKRLTALKESLAVIFYHLSELWRGFDVWVLNDNGIEQSWIKNFTIGPICQIGSPIGFWGFWGNGKVILEDGDRELFLYDPNVNEIKNIPNHGTPCPSPVYPPQAFNYMESLVSIRERQPIVEEANFFDFDCDPFFVVSSPSLQLS